MGKGPWHLLPTTPGMLPTVREHFERAVFHFVLICDPISSNNLTNSRMLYNQFLTGGLRESVCLSEHASYLACNRNNLKTNFSLENKAAFARS